MSNDPHFKIVNIFCETDQIMREFNVDIAPILERRAVTVLVRCPCDREEFAVELGYRLKVDKVR